METGSPNSKSPRRLPESRKGRLFLAGGLLVGVLVVGALLLNMLDSESRRKTVAVSTASPTATVTMATPIQDGQIELLVESVQPLDVSTGPQPIWIQVVKVTLTNMGTSPQTVAPEDQRLIGSLGREYHPDPMMLPRVNNGNGSAILIQPGDTETMNIPFSNLAAGAEPAIFMFRARPLEPGVAVKLN